MGIGFSSVRQNHGVRFLVKYRRVNGFSSTSSCPFQQRSLLFRRAHLMQIKSLKVFCDIVSRRSFSRAADENSISQSGASQIVHQLEEELGVKLIDRSKRPWVLTSEGQVYYEGCRKLVGNLYALDEEVRAMSEQVAGRVRLASIYSAGLSHIKRFVREFIELHPKAHVQVEYQHPEKVYEMVEADQIDLGLVSYPRSSRTIESTAWREESMTFVCAPEHRLAAHKEVKLSELDGLDAVGFVSDLKIRREIDRQLASRGAELKMVTELDNIEMLKRAVEINDGVSLLPDATVVREVQSGTLVAVPLVPADAFSRPLGFIRRKNKDLGNTTHRFIDFLQGKSNELQIFNGNGDNGSGQQKSDNGRTDSSHHDPVHAQ